MSPPRVQLPRLRTLVAASLVLPALFLLVLLSLGIFILSKLNLNEVHDPNKEVLTGDAAKSFFIKTVSGGVGPIQNGVSFPASAKDFWIYDGGNFNGSIRYGMFDCGSREDCLQAVEFLHGLGPDELKPWTPSRYAVVMEGLGFYSMKWPIKPRNGHVWDVRRIKDGVVYERADDEQRRMVYYAIDFDRNRVFYHYESGGFPTDEYRPGDQEDKRQDKSQ